MAGKLKDHYGPAVPRDIARMIAAVHPAFPAGAFLSDALDGYNDLELTPRAWKICAALRAHLPQDYREALKILVSSSGPPLDSTEKFGMAPFIYLPHVFFVAAYGLDHFDESMRAQHFLTQRFSAEFSIRAFLERYPHQTLRQLKDWASDPSPHVRRLVSEGTRPRLPWAPRLRNFQRDPHPVLELLELLRDDPVLYVRRSVANNLNDIGKDHPALLIEIAKRWMMNAGPERKTLLRHALRSAIKRGDPAALRLLGFGSGANLQVAKVRITPKRAKIGSAVAVSFDVVSGSTRRTRVAVDYRVHFVKADGSTTAKVFKLAELELAPRERRTVSSRVSLRQMTTRKHYKGTHGVDAILNGEIIPLGKFTLI